MPRNRRCLDVEAFGDQPRTRRRAQVAYKREPQRRIATVPLIVDWSTQPVRPTEAKLTLILSTILQKINTGLGIGFVDLMVISRSRFSTPIVAR